MTDIYCVCFSCLIFFFVKTDVDLHPNSESIPLLIDRVSILIGESESIPVTWFLKVSYDDVIFCIFWWCHCFERQHDSILNCCFFLQRSNSSSYGSNSSKFWIDFIGPKTRQFMWAQQQQSLSCLHRYCVCMLKARTREDVWNIDFWLIYRNIPQGLIKDEFYNYFNETLSFHQRPL